MVDKSRAARSETSSCVIVCSSPNGRGIHQYALELEKGIPCSAILSPRSNESFVLWEVFGIVRRYQKLRDAESIVFTNTRISPLLWGALKKQRLVVVVHDLMDTVFEDGYRELREGWLHRVRRRINSWCLARSIERANVVVANSETTSLELRKSGLLQRSRAVVLRPGPSFGRQIAHSDQMMKTWMKDQFKGLSILGVAGRSKNKCVDDYFMMFELLVGTASVDARMKIVGINEEELSDQSQAIYLRYRDRIEVMRRVEVEELLECYLGCDVYVSLSSKEGYGIPVADAMGFGIPVVARDIPPFREISGMATGVDRVILCKDAVECSRFIKENYMLWLLKHDVLDSERRRVRIEKYWMFRRYYEEYLKGKVKELWKGSGER